MHRDATILDMAIWSKGGERADELVHAFTVGSDHLYDRELAPYDLLGSLAHVTMLQEVGLVSAGDQQALSRELRRLHAGFLQGGWTVEPADEDVHSKVEAMLTATLGEAGKRLHTGRSRNDQVLTDLRLWQRRTLLQLASETGLLAIHLLAKAKAYEFHPFPGYTHQQPAMPSSLGMFFGSHAQALVDDLALLESAWTLTGRCPLGSGAGYGVSLPLDRSLTASLLGFSEPSGLAMADANGRGKVETACLDACSAVMGDLSRLSADLLFFTTSECGFFTIGQGFTTGSSIMPQKRNLDLFELVRSRASSLLGLRTALASTTIGLGSGYARDLQDTKALCLDGMRMVRAAVAVVTAAVPSIEPVRDRILRSLTPAIYATDEAYRLVREQGMPFRDAYRQVGRELDALGTPDHDLVVRSRTHAGSTGHLELEAMQGRIAEVLSLWHERERALLASWDALLGTAFSPPA